MDTKSLPDNADLGQLRQQAKELRRAYAGGSPAAIKRVAAIRPGPPAAPAADKPAAAEPAGQAAAGPAAELQLRDAQLVIAREHGFDGWRDLAAAVVAQQSSGRDLHRWFGVELNNGSWDALDNGLSEDSPPEEQELALYAAYASTYHWMQAGTVANHGRGEHLIASVAVRIGLLDVAARHAARYAELISQHPAAFADWDRAFAAEVRARVAARRHDPDAPQLRARAQELAEAVENPEDRRICVEGLAGPPW
jgi:hypothetical protein